MEFKRTYEFQPGSLKGHVTLSYESLVKAFGEPDISDEYKTSSEWVFSNGEEHFTLYDYKATNLYSSNYSSVAEFRAKKEYSWHIGGNGNPEEFSKWIVNKCKEL